MSRKTLGLFWVGLALLVSPVMAAIDGNVSNVSYDNANRIYTQVVTPPGGSQFGQRVITAISNDPTIRQNSIVRVNENDANFKYRWGQAFQEADYGYPCVGVVRESYGQHQCVYKMPLSSEADLSRELQRCGQVAYNLNADCPTCPKPRTPAKPSPLGPLGPNQPMQPLPNTPPGDAPGEDDPLMMVLAVGGGLFLGWAVIFKRG